jgi:hypothetical protein
MQRLQKRTEPELVPGGWTLARDTRESKYASAALALPSWLPGNGTFQATRIALGFTRFMNVMPRVQASIPNVKPEH